MHEFTSLTDGQKNHSNSAP